MHAETITVIASCTTTSIAAVSAVTAGLAYRSGRRGRAEQREMAKTQVATTLRLTEEQAFPYVIVQMEQDPTMTWGAQLVVRNIGKTPAYNVEVSITPAPRRSSG